MERSRDPRLAVQESADATTSSGDQLLDPRTGSTGRRQVLQQLPQQLTTDPRRNPGGLHRGCISPPRLGQGEGVGAPSLRIRTGSKIVRCCPR